MNFNDADFVFLFLFYLLIFVIFTGESMGGGEMQIELEPANIVSNP